MGGGIDQSRNFALAEIVVGRAACAALANDCAGRVRFHQLAEASRLVAEGAVWEAEVSAAAGWTDWVADAVVVRLAGSKTASKVPIKTVAITRRKRFIATQTRLLAETFRF